MLMDSGAQKVTTAHLSRLAYLYVRQSTLRQVLVNTESTHRQYALQGRAVALGWPLDRVVVIDSDWDSLAPVRLIEKASSGWSLKSVWGASESCSAWKCRDWRATPRIGIGFSNCARSPTRSSSMRMGCMIPRTSTIACCWA